MEDPALTSRLEALRNNLNVVSANLDKDTWKADDQSRATTRAELLGESLLWAGLQSLLTEIRTRLRDIDQIEADLYKAPPGDAAAVSAAWIRYGKTYGDSQTLLRECLEIIGTLAIREKNLDRRLLYVADELIRDCLTLSTGSSDYYLLVHSVSETFSRARARIIRLRFPEWTIWDLPLAAHDLGQVAMAKILREEGFVEPGDTTLTPFLAVQRDLLVASDAGLQAKNQEGGESAAEAGRWAKGRVLILLADAFATYTMGPAYAFSAIMLRLSPAVAAQRDTPSDALRAEVILNTLTWMNENTGGLAKPYSDAVEQQKKNWQSALAANPLHKLDPAEAAFAAQLADKFGSDVSNYALAGTAKYPHAGTNQGWLRASDWAGHWLQQWNDGQRLTSPPNPIGKLRDVLNATWMCRSCFKGDRESVRRGQVQLAEAGQDLCAKIIENASGRTPPPAAVVAQGAPR